MLRIAVFFGITFLVLLPFNIVAWRMLTRLHPRRRRWIVAAVAIGNLMWPFFLVLRDSTDFARATRALFGPPWFAWVCFLILYNALLLIVLLAWLPFLRKISFMAFARWPSRVFLWMSLIGSVIGYWQALVPLRVERVTLRIPSLPAEAAGMRLAVMGDLHVGLFTRASRLEKIFTTASELQPNAILLAGDLIDDDPFFTPKLLAGTRVIPPSIPLFGVLGNHEIYGDPNEFIAATRGSRLKLLVNEGAPLGKLWIAGLSDRAAMQTHKELAPDFRRALAGKPADSVPIVLSHQPMAFRDARRLGLPLVLSAHSHGGQCGIRPLGWSLAGVFIPYHMGAYREGMSQLFVTTGAGYWLVPFRLGMSPEIVLIELQPE